MLKLVPHHWPQLSSLPDSPWFLLIRATPLSPRNCPNDDPQFPELATSLKAIINGRAQKCPQQSCSYQQLFWNSLICWQDARITQNRKTKKRQPYQCQGQRVRVSANGDSGGIMTTTDCQGTAWGDSSVEHKPQSYGNSPSGQHFCYTGVTAVDVAYLYILGCCYSSNFPYGFSKVLWC